MGDVGDAEDAEDAAPEGLVDREDPAVRADLADPEAHVARAGANPFIPRPAGAVSGPPAWTPPEAPCASAATGTPPAG